MFEREINFFSTGSRATEQGGKSFYYAKIKAEKNFVD